MPLIQSLRCARHKGLCHSKGTLCRSALFWDITQLTVAIPYRHFGTTYRAHLQRSRNRSWIFRSLKMSSIVCLETSVRNYHYPLRNDTEERSSRLLRGGSLKSRMVLSYSFINLTLDGG